RRSRRSSRPRSRPRRSRRGPPRAHAAGAARCPPCGSERRRFFERGQALGGKLQFLNRIFHFFIEFFNRFIHILVRRDPTARTSEGATPCPCFPSAPSMPTTTTTRPRTPSSVPSTR